MSRLDALLRPYRARERALSVMPVVNDLQAMAVLAAWLSFPVPAWAPPIYEEGEQAGQPVPEPEDERRLWQWIWDGVSLNVDDLAGAAGVSPDDCERALRVAVNGRLIYPDGTIAKAAEVLLGSYCRSRMEPKREARTKTAQREE